MKNNSDFPQAPLCLRKQAAALTIENAINSASSANQLSFSDLEDILYRYYTEALRGAERERKAAEATYNLQMEEYKRQKAKEKEVEENGRTAGNPCSKSDT